MKNTLNITSGDCAGKSLAKAGLPGEVFVWHDILYDGPRRPGWPDDDTLRARALFIERSTAGGLKAGPVLETLNKQYRLLAEAAPGRHIVLWFDACLFDQAMLAHILACLKLKGAAKTELLCVDSFPGINPFHGLSQLEPQQLFSLYGDRRPVTASQVNFAAAVDEAFATNDPALLSGLSRLAEAPLPRVPAAAARWLQEKPDPATGIGKLERLALEAIRAGHATPPDIFKAVSKADSPPQFWGDTTLWAKINALADRNPPLVRIVGTKPRLPQWESMADLKRFKITAMPENHA
jgi:hypothetical protein